MIERKYSTFAFIFIAFGLIFNCLSFEKLYAKNKKRVEAKSTNSLILISQTRDDAFLSRWIELEGESHKEPAIKLKNNSNTDNYNYLISAEELHGERGREEEVIYYANKSIEIRESYLAYFYRAYAKERIGNHNGAISDYSKALEIEPKCHSSLNNRGYSKAKLGNYYQAIKDLNKSLSINPEFALAYQNLSWVKFETNDMQGSCDDAKKAMALGSQSTIDWFYSDRAVWCRKMR